MMCFFFFLWLLGLAVGFQVKIITVNANIRKPEMQAQIQAWKAIAPGCRTISLNVRGARAQCTVVYYGKPKTWYGQDALPCATCFIELMKTQKL